MRSIIWRLVRDTQGSNALEYGLIVALISLAIVAGAGAAGASLGNLLTNIGTQIASIAA